MAKCPRCGGYLVNNYGDISCLNCGYVPAAPRTTPRALDSTDEVVLFRHELHNLKHLKAIAKE